MQSREHQAQLRSLLKPAVIPVLTILDAKQALPLARALAAGGLTTLEVTLRTEAAIAAINIISEALASDVAVGAGTVRSPEQAEIALKAGAQFIVSPGMTPSLVQAAQNWPVPFLPGAVTASETMALADIGYATLKFFPAAQSGGIGALKALGAPLPDIKFCPTGGIDAGNAGDYLELDNVVCVGGSWVAPKVLVENQDWASIEALARDAAALSRSSS